MEFFDTHAHYTASQFSSDRHSLLASLPSRGVTGVVCPGDTLASSAQACALALEYPFLYAAVGVHPEECSGWNDDTLAQVAALAKNPRVVAIGEIGLDYYWEENPPKELQRRAFRDQLSLARQLDLPVIVHDREAHGDTMSILREFPTLRGVMHCYSGAVEDARELVKMGWMISFTGAITFKNARKAPEVIAAVPLERLMIETDSPYMAPEPFRGKRCDSGYVYRVAEKIAEIKGLSTEEVARTTYENALRFFSIPND